MSKLLKPSFNRLVVQEHRKDAYWIQAFKTFDQQVDLVAYGLSERSEINLYKNPTWQKARLSIEEGPVGMLHYDIDGDGDQDIVICYQYGENMENVDPQGGEIHWLENPGDVQSEWKKHYIGRSTAMHRLAIGYFTQEEVIQVIGLPIVERPHDIHSIVSIKLWRKPKDVYNVNEWPEELVDNCHFKVIHQVSVKKYNKLFGIQPESNLDSFIIASQEGLNWMYYQISTKSWKILPIGKGELSQWNSKNKNPGYKGSGGMSSGRIGNDPCAYIAAIEPFHGNTIAVYYKTYTNNHHVYGWPWQWKRVVLDTFDNPNQKNQGPCHFIICADMDGDGEDEFLVTMRGPEPWQGVYYYKAIDLKKEAWVKWKVSSDSAARIAIADFDNDGRLDFATIGYAVEGYYVTENPSIVIFYNEFANKKQPLQHIKKEQKKQLIKQCLSNEPKNHHQEQCQKPKMHKGEKSIYTQAPVTHKVHFSNDIPAIWLKFHSQYMIQKKSIVINLGSSPVTIGKVNQKLLSSRQSIILQNTMLYNVNEVLIFHITEGLNIGKSLVDPTWNLLGDIADFPKKVPLWKSQQFDLGEIMMDPVSATGLAAYSKQNEKKYKLKVNLWYCPSKTNCGLHNVHEKPHDFFEIHTQIYGVGVMQKFVEKNWHGDILYESNSESVTYEQILAQGETHVPFPSLDQKGEFVYPWHQYYGETECIWIAHEYHVI